MSEVKIYIYKDKQKGDGITFTESGGYVFNVNTVLPPQTKKDDKTGEMTLITTTITNTYKIPLLTLTELDYKKKIYKPCEIHANLQVEIGKLKMKTTKVTKTTTYDKDGKEKGVVEQKEEGNYSEVNNDISTSVNSKTPEVFSGKENELVKYFKGANVVMQIDGHTVAENYRVFKVRSLYKTVSSSTSLFLELTILSADKLMDLDKYSRAYTARKLYTDILAEESKQFKTVEVANHMQLVKYKDTTGTTAHDELRIPYLVQYNESFYQFMARSANRFGEFLYFENGKLNLGMQPSEENYTKVVDNNGSKTTVAIDWATEPNAVQSRYYESVLSEGIAVEDRAYNFINHEPDFKDAYADSEESRYNFDPVSTDEWTKQDLKQKEYHDFKEILGEEMKAFIPEFVFKAFEMNSIGEGLVVLIKETLAKYYEVWNSVSDYNNVLDEANYEKIANDDQKSGESFNEFATYGGSAKLSDNLSDVLGKNDINNFTDMFYSLIRKKEKEIGDQAVWLDFGSNYKPIKLGDKLQVDDVDYVAISVEGFYKTINKDGELKNLEHLLVSAIPVMTLSDTSTTTQGTTTTDKDPWTNTIPFPPALPDVMIRDARPQVAFVADTLDPQNLGRIRVRYPWQDKGGDPSPWIRVTLPLATTGGAVNFTPCVGDEVMVGYEHGNVDRPYAMGYLTAPFVNKHWTNALPLDQYGGIHGIRTKTGHHLTFEDGYALAPMLANTFGPLSFIKSLWPVGKTGVIDWPYANETTADFGGGFELSDRYGFYKIKGSTDERSVTIESPAGTVEMNAFQGISINAPNGDIEIKGKNVSISASNQMSITAGKNIKDKLWYQKNWADFALAATSVDEGISSILSETAGKFCDISFLRCVLEWLLHPVNGTLQIKSYTFVTIEAGEGKTALPPTSLRSGEKKVEEERQTLKKLMGTIWMIKRVVSRLINNINQKYDQLCVTTAEYNQLSGDEGYNKNESTIKYDTIIKKGDTELKDDSDFNWQDNNLEYEEEKFNKEQPELEGNTTEQLARYANAYDAWLREKTAYLDSVKERNKEKRLKRDRIVSVSNDLREAAKELADAAKKWTDLTDDDITTSPLKKKDVDVSALVKTIKAEKLITGTGIQTLDEMKNVNYERSIVRPEAAAWKIQKTGLSRYVIFKYLSDQGIIQQDKTMFKSVDDIVDNDSWKQYVDSLEYGGSSTGSKIWSWTKEHFKEDVFSSAVGLLDGQKQWAYGFEGKILMSDQTNRTASFDDNLTLKSHGNTYYVEDIIADLKTTLKKY